MQRYPLSWPDGWRRIPGHQRKRAKFGVRKHTYSQNFKSLTAMSVAEATSRVLGELRAFGVLDGDAIISTNLIVRLDGLPRSGQAEPADPGVAVYWERAGDRGTKVMAIDIYDRVADNLAAIAATLEAMRAIERHGGAQILERAFTGFDALPAPGQTSARGWRDVLGIPPGERRASVVEPAYRLARSQHHPDKGGDAERFNEVQRAWEEAQRELVA